MNGITWFILVLGVIVGICVFLDYTDSRYDPCSEVYVGTSRCLEHIPFGRN